MESTPLHNCPRSCDGTARVRFGTRTVSRSGCDPCWGPHRGAWKGQGEEGTASWDRERKSSRSPFSEGSHPPGVGTEDRKPLDSPLMGFFEPPLLALPRKFGKVAPESPSFSALKAGIRASSEFDEARHEALLSVGEGFGDS
jgi:hypothetical protein